MTTKTGAERLAKLPCTRLRGVGPQVAAKLKACHIETLQDLLFHLPLRYEDRTRITPLSRVRAGDHVLVEGVIVSAKKQFGGKTRLLCQLADSQGYIHLRFFFVNRAQIEAFSPGVHVRAFGEARFGPKGLEIVHPEYQVLREGQVLPVETHLTPVYPTTEGLHQTTFRKLIAQALNALQTGALLEELLPGSLLCELKMTNLRDALVTIHHPSADITPKDLLSDSFPARRRLAFEELLAHRLSLLRLRASAKTQPGVALAKSAALVSEFKKCLPFGLTRAQSRVCGDIEKDLQSNRPMMRLVQGDVGSGKTVVAVIAALQAIEQGCQVAVMAPTDILADQHYQHFSHYLAMLDVPVVFLSGKLGARVKREAAHAIANTKAAVIVGTHALFQDGVIFNQLALVIVDEQHRFGVDQRLKLKEKGVQAGVHPHQLIMTATPIPRTLAMTAYADLDNSIIDELPPGRTPVKTVLANNERRDEVIARVMKNCKAGRQVYWVCTLIEESEVLQCRAAEDTFSALQEALTGLRIGLVHGRLKTIEKDAVMARFKAGYLDVLVATTVIEVGVDVPNASIMVIENPERLGLSQLHQLRGRVGRGSQASFCVLLYQTPLSKLAQERLAIMRDSNDGFVIAQKDLETRGPGEVLGTRQTGIASFKIADVVRDQTLLPDVQTAANTLWVAHQALIDPLITRWLAGRDQYGQV